MIVENLPSSCSGPEPKHIPSPSGSPEGGGGAKNGLTILSIMVTWTLENAIETADSMKSRGYGRPGRTAFSIFTFDSRDAKAMLAICIAGLYTVIGAFCGGLYYRYFPSMKGTAVTPYSISVFAAYFILCITPVAIELWEDRKWKAFK